MSTDYSDLVQMIEAVLNRDGRHDWNETQRLAGEIAPKVWNELHQFPFVGSPDSLDATWAEAEAAKPNGYTLTLTLTGNGEYWAEARRGVLDEHPQFGEQGPTPAAALADLNAKLREAEPRKS